MKSRFCATTLGALAMLSCTQAAELEELIKGTQISGFLRYRYTDTRFTNFNFEDGQNGTGNYYATGRNEGALHSWRVNADLDTPAISGVSANLGVMYNNHGSANNGGVLGTGLGAGEDGDFGVSTFTLKAELLGSDTFVRAGKQRIDTPVHDSLDDRVTGLWFESQKVSGVLIHAGIFDTFSLDDGAFDVPFANGQNSFTQNYYTIGAKADISGFNAQFMYLGIQDLINYTFYLSAGYKHPNFHLKGEYAFSELQNEGFTRFSPTTVVKPNHALYTIDGGVRFAFAGLRLGYVGSASDGYQVALDNQGTFSMAGFIWNDYSITGIGYSPFGSLPIDEQRIHAAYGSLSLSFLDKDALQFALDYVKGGRKDRTTGEILDFTEIAPFISYQYNEKLNLLLYYAMLSAKRTQATAPEVAAAFPYADAKQNRMRVQVLYRY